MNIKEGTPLAVLKEGDKYKAIIIGLGRIGFSYDENKNKSSNPRSHLGSILANNAFSEICLPNTFPAPTPQ